MGKSGSNTAKSSRKSGDGKRKQGGPGKPFQPNNPETGERDERINREGIRHFDDLRHRVLDLLTDKKEVKVKDKAGKETVTIFTPLDGIILDWMTSKEYQKQKSLVEIGYGKVPDEVHNNQEILEFIAGNLDLFTDGQLDRLRRGEKPMVILGEVLRDVLTEKSKPKKG